MEKDVLVTLVRTARERIADKQHWCRRAFARRRSGHRVTIQSAAAVRWCALGALYRVAEEHGVPERVVARAEDRLRAAAIRRYPQTATPGEDILIQLNDRWGHDAVCEVYDAVLADLTAPLVGAEEAR